MTGPSTALDIGKRNRNHSERPPRPVGMPATNEHTHINTYTNAPKETPTAKTGAGRTRRSSGPRGFLAEKEDGAATADAARRLLRRRTCPRRPGTREPPSPACAPRRWKPALVTALLATAEGGNGRGVRCRVNGSAGGGLYIPTAEYYSATKRREPDTGYDVDEPRGLMPSGVSQS